MEVFKHLISIKNPISNVPLNIFVFNNWKKSNACRFLNCCALKWYEARRLKKYLWGQILYRNLDPTKNYFLKHNSRKHIFILFQFPKAPSKILGAFTDSQNGLYLIGSSNLVWRYEKSKKDNCSPRKITQSLLSCWYSTAHIL